MKNLQHKIAKLNANLANLRLEIKVIFGRSIQDFQSGDLTEKSLQIGDKVPNFSLMNSLHSKIELGKLLENGTVSVAFFRGNWCPYCNPELRLILMR